MTRKKCCIIKSPLYLPQGPFVWPFDSKRALILLEEATFFLNLEEFQNSDFFITLLTNQTRSWGFTDFVFSAYTFLYHKKEIGYKGWETVLCLLLHSTLTDKVYIFIVNNYFPVQEDRKDVIGSACNVLETQPLVRASKESFQNFFFFFQLDKKEIDSLILSIFKSPPYIEVDDTIGFFEDEAKETIILKRNFVPFNQIRTRSHLILFVSNRFSIYFFTIWFKLFNKLKFTKD